MPMLHRNAPAQPERVGGVRRCPFSQVRGSKKKDDIEAARARGVRARKAQRAARRAACAKRHGRWRRVVRAGTPGASARARGQRAPRVVRAPCQKVVRHGMRAQRFMLLFELLPFLCFCR